MPTKADKKDTILRQNIGRPFLSPCGRRLGLSENNQQSQKVAIFTFSTKKYVRYFPALEKKI